MTTVVIFKNDSDQYTGFSCMGHAGYARRFLFHTEPDILCAAISVLTENTVNGLAELAGEDLTVTQNAENGFLKVDFNTPLKENSILLFESMILSLNEISKEYGTKYLTVEIKEVRENAET